MEKKYVTKVMSLFLAVALVMTMAGGVFAAPAKGSIVINYTTWASDGEAAYEGMKQFKNLMEKGSNGVITVKLFPSNQAGTTDEQFEQVAMGTMQMMSSGVPGSDKLDLLALPYLIGNLNQFAKVLNSPLVKGWNKEIADKTGVMNIDILPRNPRIISCNKAINKPTDMKGLKIRTPQEEYYTETFKAFGATPTVMDIGEVYSAIKTGVVSGQENPIETIVSYGFQNICKYLIVTNHISKPAYVAINVKFFDNLTPQYQKLLLKSCADSRKFAEKYAAQKMGSYYKACKDAGMTIIKPDLEPFKKVTQPVRDKLGVKAWGADGYKQILAVIAKSK